MIGMLFKLSLSRFFFQSQNFLVILGGNLLESPQNGTGTAGIKRPTITFSFSPTSLSTLPATAASVRTRVVSWKDAAEINDLVCSEALVIPSRIGSA